MDILFEDKDILVVNKPAGLAVQTEKLGEKSLETECRKYRKTKGEPTEIFVVHRLDQPVSGIMVLAKNKDSASKLSTAMQRDDFSKKYRAVAYKGKEIPKEGTLTDYLVKDAKTNSSKVVEKTVKGAKESILSYKMTEVFEKTLSLDISLVTGRHHQIRVQFANRGCPLLGDLKYGTKESIDYSKEKGFKTVALCSCHLEFKHPTTGKAMSFDI